jgi:hypothetical protein
VFLFTIFLAEISYVATSFEEPLYTERWASWISSSSRTSPSSGTILRFGPSWTCRCIVLMLFLPAILWLMKWKADVTGAVGRDLCADLALRLVSIDLSNGFWAFNPFAGNCVRVRRLVRDGRAVRVADLLSPVTMWIYFAYLFAAFCVTLTWCVPQLGHVMPRRIRQWMYPIQQDRPRRAAVRALWRWRRSPCASCPGLVGLKSPTRPLILCGQHSLEIFCAASSSPSQGISC